MLHCLMNGLLKSLIPQLRIIVGLAVVAVILAPVACFTGGDTAVVPGESAGAATPTAAASVEDPGGAPGVFDDRIVFGQSAAFSGPAAQLGQGMHRGIMAAFAEANRNGGVNGRRLELVPRDDTYEPEAAIANTAGLIEEDGVFALIGAVGTPTSRSATPVAKEAGVPYIGPFTGAAFLRDAAQLPNVINMRASYNQETEEMVERLTTDLGIERIAVMYQDDSFGRAGYQGALAALERRGMEPVAVGLYQRNTTAVKTGVLDLRRGEPQGVILVGAYRPVAAAISWARYIGMDEVRFVTISFVGSNALAEELREHGPKGGAGVFVTQVVPFPSDESIPVVASYLQALSAHAADAVPGFVSFEGYLTGRLAIAGLERCGRAVSRSCFLEGFRSADPVDLDGFELQYGRGDNQGSDTVFLTMIHPNGDYVPIENLPKTLPERLQ